MFLLSLTYYGYAAFNFPVLFNVDNNVNYEATSYIAKHHKIPVVAAEDKEIYFTQIGIYLYCLGYCRGSSRALGG